MIPFNKPYLLGSELQNIELAHRRGQLSGDGDFTKSCQRWLEDTIGTHKALLTHSCTAALEMAAILSDVSAGDEVIMPSYTFVSTANAFVLRGARPVFVDIDSDSLCIDEEAVLECINARTKAIVPVHYAGISCDMDRIIEIANQHGLLVIEDAAQAVQASYKGKALGSLGDFGALSFHETKNIISGEGGALLINDPHFADRAEIIREKGTNRSRFFRGQVDKYTWCDLGSSYLPGEIVAAFLAAQMDHADMITNRRLDIWHRYHAAFEELEHQGRIKRPYIPEYSNHNAHMYYILLENLEERARFLNYMRERNISCVFHYLPLHSSSFGRCNGYHSGTLINTQHVSETIARLPLWIGVEEYQDQIISSILEFFRQ